MEDTRTQTKESVTLIRSEYRELRQWLQRVNCQQYYSKLVDHGITFDLVTELDSEALRELGITKVGDRIRMEIAIAALRVERLSSTAIRFEDIDRLLREAIGEGVYHSAPTLYKEASTAPASPLPPAEVSTPSKETGSSSRDKTATFILQDGSVKKINISGCFNAQSIKRKVLKKLGFKQPDIAYDAYIHSKTNSKNAIVSLLFDVELVTVCYTPERDERHRIMFCPHGEEPSEQAQETSRKISLKQGKTASRMKDLSEFHISESQPSNQPLRNFFGQRPPSELISSNLAEYFPETKQKDLEQTVKNSVRHSVRLSKRIPGISSSGSSIMSANNSMFTRRMSDMSSFSQAGVRKNSVRTIGDVMVNNITAIDEAVSTTGDNQSIVSKSPSLNSGSNAEVRSITSVQSQQSRGLIPPRIPYAASFAEPQHGNNRSSRIELFHVDSSDDESEDEEGFDSSSQSLGGIEGPKHWLKGARIGAGSFGTVFLGMNPFTGELMAVKQISLPKKNSPGDVQKSMIEQEREMTLLKQLNHENIVRYYGSSTDENNLNIFLEYVPGGSVQSMLKSYGPFEEPLIRNFIRQVLIGLAYLHGEDIIHRDIKGANILIDIKGTVKIGDFGISKKVSLDEDGQPSQQVQPPRRSSLQGSVYWMAPEVVKQTAYTKKADIWSVGCLIVEMFTGKHPFPEFSQMQAIFKIGTHISPQIPEWCTMEGKDFLGMTFELDYNKRPDAVDLLAMPFLNPLIMSKS